MLAQPNTIIIMAGLDRSTHMLAKDGLGISKQSNMKNIRHHNA